MKETVTLMDAEAPHDVVEEDRFKLTFRVQQAGPDAFTVEVSRILIESIVDGKAVPAATDGKPLTWHESWLRNGEADFSASEDVFDRASQRLSASLHIPLGNLTRGQPYKVEQPIGAIWRLLDITTSTAGERWKITYTETTKEATVTGTGTFMLDPATGLPKSIDLTLDNATPRGGQLPMRIHIARTTDKLPAL